jgi:plastocyanin
MSRRAFATVSLASCLVLLLAAAPQAAVVVKAVASDASPTGYAFRPKTLEVAPGTKVTWKAVSGSHDVTSTSKNWSKSSPLQIGLTTIYTFTKAGTYRYRCTIHSSIVDGRCRGQCGKVVVG